MKNNKYCQNCIKILHISIFLSIFVLFSTVNVYSSTDGEVVVKYKPDLELEKDGIGEDNNIVVVKSAYLSTSRLIELFRNNPDVEYVEANEGYIASISSFDEYDNAYDEDEGVDPNDELFDLQWYLDNDARGSDYFERNDIRAKQAWDSIDSEFSIPIGVLDTGVDYNHPDLINQIWLNPGEFPNSKFPGLDIDHDSIITFSELVSWDRGGLRDFNNDGIINFSDLFVNHPDNRYLDGIDDDDFDNNSETFIDDFIGWNFIDNTNNPLDDHDHGTHISGILAAERNNGIGISGVDPQARIVAIKIFPESGNIEELEPIIRGIDYSVNLGLKITNNSWGLLAESGGPSSLRDVIEYAMNSNQLFLTAAGNWGFDIDDGTNFQEGGYQLRGTTYPAAYDLDNIMVVGNSDEDDKRNGSSNFGFNSVDIFAPGTKILSCIRSSNNKLYESYSGTSMATPLVTGAASNFWRFINSKGGDFDFLSIKNQIINFSDYAPNLDGLSRPDSNGLSGKRLNMYRLFAPEINVVFKPEYSGSGIEKGGVVKARAYIGLNGEFENGNEYNFTSNGRYTFKFISDENVTIEKQVFVDWFREVSFHKELPDIVNEGNYEGVDVFGGCYRDKQVRLSIKNSKGVEKFTDLIDCVNGRWELVGFSIHNLLEDEYSFILRQDTVPMIEKQIVIDISKPNINIISPVNGSEINSSSLLIKGNTEENSNIYFSIHGLLEKLYSQNGEFSYEVEVPEGGNQISIMSEDRAGNKSDIVNLFIHNNNVGVSNEDVDLDISDSLDEEDVIVEETVRSAESIYDSTGDSYSDLIVDDDDLVFPDIINNPHKLYIQDLFLKNIINGYSTGDFQPDRKITRAEVAKIIVNAFGLQIDSSGKGFDDIQKTNPFYSYIQTLKNMQIINGYSDGNFRPAEYVTRGQVAKLIVLSMEKSGYEFDTSNLSSKFTDISETYRLRLYIYALSNLEHNSEYAVKGYSDGSFRPLIPVSRGEITKILYISMQNMGQ